MEVILIYSAGANYGLYEYTNYETAIIPEKPVRFIRMTCVHFRTDSSAAASLLIFCPFRISYLILKTVK